MNEVYRHFCSLAEWKQYRFSFSGSGVHGRPEYSGRSAGILGFVRQSSLLLRLKFGHTLDHDSRAAGSWERKPGSALYFAFAESAGDFAPDMVTLKQEGLVLRLQALDEKTLYLDLQRDGGLLFSGKVHRSLRAWTLWFASRLESKLDSALESRAETAKRTLVSNAES
ncbi:MAG: hypothetical protein KDK23_05355 [Leptospiraceae bacterium]|nr:hypothetical protein [Leptospiraceae bacterium]